MFQAQAPMTTMSFRKSLMTCLLKREAPGIMAGNGDLWMLLSSSSAARCQSSLCTTTGSSTTAASAAATEHSSSFLHHHHNNNKRQRGAVVDPRLRQRRPLVNGKPVAFHVHDLVAPPSSSPPPPPLQVTTSSTNAQEFVRKRQYDSDLIVVLDMDECLLHSQFLTNPSMAQVLAHQLQIRRRNDKGTPVDHFRVQLPDGAPLVLVNVRPGLPAFLEEITSKYETHIFTASLPSYANPLLDKLDPDGTKFAARWYRSSCTYDSATGAYVKNLSTLPIPNLARTVLIDNHPLSFLSNPSNGILVPSFFNDPEDTSLHSIPQLLEELNACEDVRPVLEERFALKQSLDKIVEQMIAKQAKKKNAAWRRDAWSFWG